MEREGEGKEREREGGGVGTRAWKKESNLRSHCPQTCYLVLIFDNTGWTPTQSGVSKALGARALKWTVDCG